MGSVPLWTRVVADERFRAALVEEALRAVADAGDVAVSPEQMRRLEGMDREERAELVGEVVKEVHLRGAEARFGRIGPDGRLGRY
jgi:hypothetical protein